MPATYEVKLVSAGTVTIHSAKLFFTGSELPADDCQIQGSKVTVRQTQQVTAQTKTELVVEFGPNTDAGEATIHMISER
jgi:hypothetical protein